MSEATVWRPAVVLDRTSAVPLHHQLSSHMAAIIRSGQVSAQTRVENEVELAKRLGVSRPTTRTAMQHLVNAGLVVRRRGVGTVVTAPQIHRTVRLSSLYDDLKAAEHLPVTQVLSHQVVPADDVVAAALKVPVGTPVVCVRRLRLSDGEPLALMTNYLPAASAPTVEQLTADGLYAALRDAGIVPSIAHQRIGARRATAGEAELLHESPGAAVLWMERTAFTAQARAVEFGRHIYRSDRFTFETTVMA